MTRAGYIGLGSNLGDRADHLRAAIDQLGAGGAPVSARSDVYETAPVGEFAGEQTDFLNMVVAIDTDLSPGELLDLCKAIEAGRGRDLEGPRHGPRPLDADILVLGDLALRGDRLTIPHPALTERRFVLEPLLEIAPDLVLPSGGPPLAEMLARAAGQDVRRLGPLGGLPPSG